MRLQPHEIRDLPAHDLTVHGVPGKLKAARVQDKPELLAHCQWVGRGRLLDGDKIIPVIRWDDSCGNGHNTFSTFSITDKHHGCSHEAIAEAFPELEHLIQWHLVSEDGPLHYLANSLYHASDRDCWGYRAGEACRFSDAIKFGDFPIVYEVGSRFAQWLKTANLSALEIERVDHSREPRTFGPKYKPAGYEAGWADCPWDTLEEAEQVEYALRHYEVGFIKTPTAYSEGKERDLEAFRSAAIWPEATEETISLPREVLKCQLEDRYPDLMNRFFNDLKDTGIPGFVDHHLL